MDAHRGDAIKTLLSGSLTDNQRKAIRALHRRVMVVAGAGSGKTEVMARRVAWWVGAEGVDRASIVAFTFTEAAAEELKFRIRKHLRSLSPSGKDATLGGMYVGTIHGFCLQMLRTLDPTTYHNHDILDESARLALIHQGFHTVLGLKHFQDALRVEAEAADKFGPGTFETADKFLRAYDLLNEYDILEVSLGSKTAPDELKQETEWCKRAVLNTRAGDSEVAKAFSVSAARYYAYLLSRRFLDFSTSQSELTRLLRGNPIALERLRTQITHLVVDEVQDVNPVQDALIRLIVGETGRLTAVGDHRQSIYAFRGSRVDLMGRLHDEIKASKDGEVVVLEENFRSTPRILGVANAWADTIGKVGGLANSRMKRGSRTREDWDAQHVGLLAFGTRQDEAAWIAERIGQFVKERKGAAHDGRDGTEFGVRYSDIAILLRSSTDARAYMEALRAKGIPAVVRAGPDLFSQVEVLLFLACLARMCGLDEFRGSGNRPGTIPARCEAVLGVEAKPEEMIQAACARLAAEGIPVQQDLADRLLSATMLLERRLEGDVHQGKAVSGLRSKELRAFLVSGKAGKRRERVFPQKLLHLVFAEAELGMWKTDGGQRGASALFHLGQLSKLVMGLEMPGWVPVDGFKYRVAALAWWGARNARPEESPLLVAPDAVTISTVHGAKGLEWPVVFLADVAAQRFPSNFARRVEAVPFDPMKTGIDPGLLADNGNYDHERRLMYVALTRAERYLYVSKSGERTSRFFTELTEIFRHAGAAVGSSSSVRPKVAYAAAGSDSEARLSTSFSDLRYYVECPHDFYLRKALGFAPGIDESFGYGRGVHNLLREVHSDPKKWAVLALDERALKKQVQRLIDKGLMYLRYTTGDPAEAMKAKAGRVVGDYVRTYASELHALEFEPEREFEASIPEANALVSGAIDVIRRDDPPRVTLLDFKSGHAESDAKTKLDEREMKLQVSIYALAAREELEYEPEKGLIRYLDHERGSGKREVEVPLDAASLEEARRHVVSTVKAIKDRRFDEGPRAPRAGGQSRCTGCDFGSWCGRKEARAARKGK